MGIIFADVLSQYGWSTNVYSELVLLYLNKNKQYNPHLAHIHAAILTRDEVDDNSSNAVLCPSLIHTTT